MSKHIHYKGYTIVEDTSRKGWENFKVYKGLIGVGGHDAQGGSGDTVKNTMLGFILGIIIFCTVFTVATIALGGNGNIANIILGSLISLGTLIGGYMLQEKVVTYGEFYGTFEDSLIKMMLDRGEGDRLVQHQVYPYERYAQNTYNEALFQNNSLGAEKLKELFKREIPEDYTEREAYYSLISDLIKEVEKQNKAIRDKVRADEDAEIAQKKENLKKEIEGSRPGFNALEGSYVWNPNEIINVGEMR